MTQFNELLSETRTTFSFNKNLHATEARCKKLKLPLKLIVFAEASMFQRFLAIFLGPFSNQLHLCLELTVFRWIFLFILFHKLTSYPNCNINFVLNLIPFYVTSFVFVKLSFFLRARNKFKKIVVFAAFI